MTPIPNIGPRGQRRRLRFGVMSFGAAALVGAILFKLDAPTIWRLVLFLPLWMAALGFFQARDRT